ncbi:MAG: DTW domain-containing protein [Colwellia sp.]|nr:DTW domain-containing protein [Colwellia sp.]MCW8866459.1 DTW domain-containing protein [Colwellia sp.]MCW9083201.1 DTW domain-containing protein [Colwellia sp.]
MSRALCQHCQRPGKACICAFITAIDNTIPIVVLQHPNEVDHSKGTVALLTRSLKHCQIIVGENFTNNEELATVLAQYQALLLYPSEDAKVLAFQANGMINIENSSKAHCLVILDGTWKKAYKMFMLSENLQRLPQVCLPESLANNGQYLIRKVAKANALSSLEACCYALALLEGNNNSLALKRYQPLLNKFAQFNQFQLSFRHNKKSTS